MFPRRHVLKNIIHLSDLHIRNESYYNKPLNGHLKNFEKVLNSRKDVLNNKNSIVVVSGDIFHNKEIITPSCMDILFNLYEKVLRKFIVVTIPGNHDYNQKNYENAGILEEMMKIVSSRNKNRIFVNKTGIVKVTDDVSLSVLDVKQVFTNGVSQGQNSAKNLMFPVEPRSEIMIGVCHIPVDQPFGELKSVDIFPKTPEIKLFLLGDIHKPTIKKLEETGQVYTYPGSLYQTSKAEEPFVHGFNVISIPDLSIEHVKIPPGFLCFVPFDVYEKNKENVPQNCFIENIQYEDEEEFKKVENSHISFNKSLKVSLKGSNGLKGLREPPKIAGEENVDILSFDSFCKKVLKEKEKNMIPEIIFKKLEKKNVKNNLENLKKKPYEILEVCMKNIFCFPEEKFVDLRKKDDNDVIEILRGRNGTGKSKFLEGMYMALFGRNFASKVTRKKDHSQISGYREMYSIPVEYTINNDNAGKERKSSSFTRIKILLDNKYEVVIHRQFLVQKDRNTCKEKVTMTINPPFPEKYDQDPNVFVETFIDSSENFLQTTMMQQCSQDNFFGKSMDEQISILFSHVDISEKERVDVVLKESRSELVSRNFFVNERIGYLEKAIQERSLVEGVEPCEKPQEEFVNVSLLFDKRNCFLLKEEKFGEYKKYLKLKEEYNSIEPRLRRLYGCGISLEELEKFSFDVKESFDIKLRKKYESIAKDPKMFLDVLYDDMPSNAFLGKTFVKNLSRSFDGIEEEGKEEEEEKEAWRDLLREDDLKFLKDVFQVNKKYFLEMYERIFKLKSLMKKYDDWFTKGEIEVFEYCLQKDINSIGNFKQLVVASAEYLEFQKRKENNKFIEDMEKEVLKYKAEKTKIDEEKKFVSELKEKYLSFYAETFNEHILPPILSIFNEIREAQPELSKNVPKINLKVNVREDEKPQLIWEFTPPGQKVHVSNFSCLSGFQKEIISFIIRVTRIHLSSKSSLMVLDEPFLSSDAENLREIPQFLKNLPYILPHLSKILLVTHSDILSSI